MDGNGADNFPRTRGDLLYDKAMADSADLLVRIREAGREADLARSLVADIWSQAQNMPFMTTVYEAIQEAKSGPETMQDKRYVPILVNGSRRLP